MLLFLFSLFLPLISSYVEWFIRPFYYHYYTLNSSAIKSFYFKKECDDCSYIRITYAESPSLQSSHLKFSIEPYSDSPSYANSTDITSHRAAIIIAIKFDLLRHFVSLDRTSSDRKGNLSRKCYY